VKARDWRIHSENGAQHCGNLVTKCAAKCGSNRGLRVWYAYQYERVSNAFAYDRHFGGPRRVHGARGLLPPQSSRYDPTAGPSSLEIGRHDGS
jgi:hypothetical protein